MGWHGIGLITATATDVCLEVKSTPAQNQYEQEHYCIYKTAHILRVHILSI